MTTPILSSHQRRARSLASNLERRALLLLEGVPTDDDTIRGRVLAAAGVVISSASPIHPRETAQLAIPAGLVLGRATRADMRLTAVPTEVLGMTVDSLTLKQRKEREERHRRADALLRVSILARFRQADRLHNTALDYVADSLALFEELPVIPAHFDAVHAAVVDGSGLTLVDGGYRLRGADGRERGRIADADLGAGRTRDELRVSAAEARDEFMGTIELILALLALAHLGTEGVDALLTDAVDLGLDISGVDDAAEPTPDDLVHLADRYETDLHDARLRWDFRRSNHIRAQLGPALRDAQRLAREEREAAEDRARIKRMWKEREAKQEAQRAAQRRAADFERREWYLERGAGWPDAESQKEDTGPALGD